MGTPTETQEYHVITEVLTPYGTRWAIRELISAVDVEQAIDPLIPFTEALETNAIAMKRRMRMELGWR